MPKKAIVLYTYITGKSYALNILKFCFFDSLKLFMDM